ncbi:hypothetical protein BDQ12DRAFT_668696 [Crucibulum laeve]|uniref:Uncharacterized protein n=1 Tax=Crucibulum laeve TaxID=68775 RepID=A0A5C3LRH0_9AGAR|nr:hypothetical protein BDQ12DRAFT_668696 [Crucibulum laeve]
MSRKFHSTCIAGLSLPVLSSQSSSVMLQTWIRGDCSAVSTSSSKCTGRAGGAGYGWVNWSPVRVVGSFKGHLEILVAVEGAVHVLLLDTELSLDIFLAWVLWYCWTGMPGSTLMGHLFPEASHLGIGKREANVFRHQGVVAIYSWPMGVDGAWARLHPVACGLVVGAAVGGEVSIVECAFPRGLSGCTTRASRSRSFAFLCKVANVLRARTSCGLG